MCMYIYSIKSKIVNNNLHIYIYVPVSIVVNGNSFPKPNSLINLKNSEYPIKRPPLFDGDDLLSSKEELTFISSKLFEITFDEFFLVEALPK